MKPWREIAIPHADASDPNAIVRITLEIDAEFPQGATDAIKRSVSENATSLEFKTKEWE
jgi:hypothetical protein